MLLAFLGMGVVEVTYIRNLLCLPYLYRDSWSQSTC